VSPLPISHLYWDLETTPLDHYRPSLDFSRGLVGSEGAGAGRLLMLIVVDGYDRAPVVASVGRAFQAGGVFRLVGSGFLG